ncbi:MAG TPA: CDP-6-deoxy-delta-3,4-glucoseen reductase [Gammaproteobacteria bacterium]|nr:CDP-6-deoxy-delta-3,4-glucoseen reductase [Gammaproteobacteria bacterium]
MSHHVRIENTEHEFDVEPGESVLDAALRQGLMLPYSCRGGTCASCAGKVVEGEVAYPDGRPPALNETEEAVGQAIFCQAQPRTDLVIEVREVRSAEDIQPRRLPCRVESVEDLAHDVRRLWLRTPGNERLQFLAGQYINILLRGGLHRAYSLANAPHDDELLEIHVRHLAGGRFSDYVFGDMKERALLRFEGPFGTFFLREDSPRPILMMGGGTGFAPLKGMIEHARHIGVRRPIHLYWGVRSRRDLYLDALARGWAAEDENFEYSPVLSDPSPEDDWQGHIGLVHNILLGDHPNLSEFDVYMSGPPGMIQAARRDFAAHGLDPAHLYYDSFEQAIDPPADD